MTLLQHVVVPVASKNDADQTCAALTPHLDEVDRVTAVHVIEKAGGSIDKAPMEKRESDAEAMFAVVESQFGDSAPVETKLVYHTDVVDGLFEAAEEADATSVAFVAREGGRLVRLLSGDTAMRIVTEATVPVVALPRTDAAD